MAEKGDSDKSVLHIDQKDLTMYGRYVQERAWMPEKRKELAELAKEFGIPERTFLRRVLKVQKALDVLKTLDQSTLISIPPAPKKGGTLPAVRETAFSGLSERDRDAYSAIVTPTRNPLDGLQQGEISQAGVATGIVFGSGVVKMGEALSNRKRPLGERALLMTQGSTAVACTLLGIFEALNAFGSVGNMEQKMKEVDEHGDLLDK